MCLLYEHIDKPSFSMMKMSNNTNVPDDFSILHETLHERNRSVGFLVPPIGDIEIECFHRCYNRLLDSLSILLHDKILSIRIDFLHVGVIFLFLVQHDGSFVVLVVIAIEVLIILSFLLIILIVLRMTEFTRIVLLFILQLNSNISQYSIP